MILITPRSNHNKISLPTIQVGTSDVTPSESARNIGVMFDANMSMTTQITTMCRSSWYQLRNIREVRHSLTTEATIRLVCALLFSQIDYGNILLYGAPGCLLQKLQRVQNSAARLVTKFHGRITLHPSFANCIGCQSSSEFSTNCLLPLLRPLIYNNRIWGVAVYALL